jgi:Na+/phosphate symporter
MGKHDKQVDNQTLDKMTPEEEREWYRAKIKHLQNENTNLNRALLDARNEIARMTVLYEKCAESIQRNEARSDEIIERKNEEIEMAKEAIYLAAMREVSLR